SLAILTIALICILSAVSLFFIGKTVGNKPLPSYHQLTFRRGTISAARFAPDGQTIFYNAAWNGNQISIFTARVENPISRMLGIDNADILSISSTGEMAILLKRSY